MRGLGLAILLAVLQAAPSLAGDVPPETPALFSSAKPGDGFPGQWRLRQLPNSGYAVNRFSLVKDEQGTTVLKVESRAATGALTQPLSTDLSRTPWLLWRWKADRVVAAADLASKDGDDYAATLFVLFAPPADSLGSLEALRLDLARMVYGSDLPARALCYVWDNRHPVGTQAWNAYTERVRMIVVTTGAKAAGTWHAVARNIAADYRQAFGADPPPVAGIAVGADTDETRQAVTAEFGDVRFAAAPPPGR